MVELIISPQRTKIDESDEMHCADSIVKIANTLLAMIRIGKNGEIYAVLEGPSVLQVDSPLDTEITDKQGSLSVILSTPSRAKENAVIQIMIYRKNTQEGVMSLIAGCCVSEKLVSRDTASHVNNKNQAGVILTTDDLTAAMNTISFEVQKSDG